MRVRLLSLILGAFVLLFLSGGDALGHANPVRALPAPDSRLASAPREVRLNFSEGVSLKLSSIQVLDSRGHRVDTGDLQTSDRTTLAIGLSTLPDGGYTVVWATQSADDGHETGGAYGFVIGEGPLPSVVHHGGHEESPLDALARLVSYLAVCLLVGVPLCARLVLDAQSRVAHWCTSLARAGGVLTLLGVLLTIAASPERLGALLSAPSASLLLRISAGILAFAPTPPLPRLSAGLLLAAGLSLNSHAAAAGEPGQILVDLVHLLSAGAWIGGLLLLLLSSLERPRALAPRTLAAHLAHFTPFGLSSILVLFLSGTLALTQRLASPLDLLYTSYGLLLVGKSLLLAVALGLAALTTFRLRPLLQTGQTTARLRTQRGIRIELGVVGTILLLSAVLSGLEPGSASRGTGYRAVEYVDGVRVELRASSTAPGAEDFTLLLNQTFPPQVSRVRLRYALPTRDIAEAEITLRAQDHATYGASTILGLSGVWQLYALIERPGLEELRVSFTLPLAEESLVPHGNGATGVSNDYAVLAREMAPHSDPTLAVNVLTAAAQRGIAEAFRILNAAPASQHSLYSDHDLEHAIGRLGYSFYADAGAAFAACAAYPSASGCAHGVGEGFIAQHPKPTAAQVAPLCDGVPSATECAHGIGHGLLSALVEPALPLTLCTSLHTGADTCSEGVFMEMAREVLNENRPLALSRDTPNFPCTSYPASVQPACYKVQPRYWLGAFYADDPGRAALLCSGVPAASAEACAEGLGKAFGEQIQTAAEGLRLCAGAADALRDVCRFYLLNGGVLRDAASAAAVCAQISTQPSQGLCTHELVARLTYAGVRPEEARSYCATLPDTAATECRALLR